MDLELAVRRAKTLSLFLMALTLLLAGLAILYSYELQKTNAELEELKTLMSQITAEYGVTLGGRDLHRTELDAAIQDLSKGLGLRDDPQLYASRCFAYMKSGQLQKALQDCNHAIDLKPDNYWVPYNTRGFVHYLLGNDLKAVSDWKRAAKYRSRPSSEAQSLENLGLVYLRAEDWGKALANADDVFALCSECAWNCLFRGIAADQLGKEAVAADALTCWREHADHNDSEQMTNYLPSPLHRYLESETPKPTSVP